MAEVRNQQDYQLVKAAIHRYLGVNAGSNQRFLLGAMRGSAGWRWDSDGAILFQNGNCVKSVTVRCRKGKFSVKNDCIAAVFESNGEFATDSSSCQKPRKVICEDGVAYAERVVEEL